MSLKRFVLLFSAFAAAVSAPAQISISPSLANFFTVYTDSPDSLQLTVTNNSTVDYKVTDVDVWHRSVFTVTDTAFTIAPGGSHSLWVKCAPRHNLTYADQLIFRSTSHPDGVRAFVYALCRYPDTYYDATQNKSHEDLKTALKTTISTGTADLGYNGARDKMYMEIDNQMVNGQGASQNTLECVYTGRQAVGYTSRTDCQTNDNFNTEHTFPQSMFGSVSPMQSDLHHIFPTDNPANSERANKPFGVVSSPTWTNGGSKSNSTTFEPRDVHKGRAGRALFYMVIRYQDYTGFVAPQEAILRQWHHQFLPNTVDINRNDDIYANQNNRNPFIDHPEFLDADRMAAVCTANNGDVTAKVWYNQDTVYFGDVLQATAWDGAFLLSNQGITALTVSNAAVSGADFALLNTPATSLAKDSLQAFDIRFSPSGPGTSLGHLTFNTSDAAHSAMDIVLIGTGIVTSLDGPTADRPACWPNPATDAVQVRNPGADVQVTLCDLTGHALRSHTAPAFGTSSLSLRDLPAGLYSLRMQRGSTVWTEKLVVQH